MDRLNEYIRHIEIDYAVCGGSAIDLFVGQKTRPHKDLDVSVYWEDRDKIVQYMLDDGWDIYEPCGSEHLHKINNIKDQKRVKSNIWCVKHTNPHYKFIEQDKDMYSVSFDGSEQTQLDFIEYLFNNRDSEHFIYTRNHSIKRELKNAILKAKDVMYLAPEVVLLYKSSALNNPDHQHDFDISIPKMNKSQIEWLKNALVKMFPEGHEWLK